MQQVQGFERPLSRIGFVELFTDVLDEGQPSRAATGTDKGVGMASVDAAASAARGITAQHLQDAAEAGQALKLITPVAIEVPSVAFFVDRTKIGDLGESVSVATMLFGTDVSTDTLWPVPEDHLFWIVACEHKKVLADYLQTQAKARFDELLLTVNVPRGRTMPQVRESVVAALNDLASLMFGLALDEKMAILAMTYQGAAMWIAGRSHALFNWINAACKRWKGMQFSEQYWEDAVSGVLTGARIGQRHSRR